jgi:hypothetical protein
MKKSSHHLEEWILRPSNLLVYQRPLILHIKFPCSYDYYAEMFYEPRCWNCGAIVPPEILDAALLVGAEIPNDYIWNEPGLLYKKTELIAKWKNYGN